MREKLIELLVTAKYDVDRICIERDWCDGCPAAYGEGQCKEVYIADHLIANGVTVQKWISVKDERKPNHGDIALCYMTFGEYRLLQWDDRSKLWVGDYMDFGFEDAAYWQMPQQPKGE